MDADRHVWGHTLVNGSARRIEPLHPPFVVRHPTLSGWIWLAAAVVLLVVCETWLEDDGAGVVVSLIGALPSLGATLLVLAQTPRTHLEYEESILGHFFARFFAVLGALILWVGSVVLGAAVAVQLAQDTGADPEKAWVEAFEIFGAVVPFIVAMLWAVLVFRCVGYIARLRGWAGVPERHRIPDGFLTALPRTRRVVTGLAHPLLLLVAGLLSIVVAIVAAAEVASSSIV